MGTEISASILSGSKAKSITIRAGEHVIAPDLAEVSSYVLVDQGGTFTAPALAEVSSYVLVDQGGTFTAPALAKAGDVIVYQGGTFTAPALAEVSGDVLVYQGGTFTAPKYDSDLVFHEIENDGEYALCRNANWLYHAGCRGPFTEEQALEHWDGRQDRRATLFAAAIRNAGAL